VDDPDLEGRAQARPELQMINDLALGFLQLVQVTYQPGLHRVLKVAYDVPQAWSDPTANRWWERGLRAVAALPRRQTFSNVNLGQGMGYHVEVIAPEDTELVEAKLTGGQWSTRESKECPLNLVVLCYVCHSGWVSWRSGSRLRSTGCWQV
ncbi:MAG TPA: hypothetical protein VIK04_05920, partial [Solirubrobacteraceae bacterium]